MCAYEPRAETNRFRLVESSTVEENCSDPFRSIRRLSISFEVLQR